MLPLRKRILRELQSPKKEPTSDSEGPKDTLREVKSESSSAVQLNQTATVKSQVLGTSREDNRNGTSTKGKQQNQTSEKTITPKPNRKVKSNNSRKEASSSLLQASHSQSGSSKDPTKQGRSNSEPAQPESSPPESPELRHRLRSRSRKRSDATPKEVSRRATSSPQKKRKQKSRELSVTAKRKRSPRSTKSPKPKPKLSSRSNLARGKKQARSVRKTGPEKTKKAKIESVSLKLLEEMQYWRDPINLRSRSRSNGESSQKANKESNLPPKKKQKQLSATNSSEESSGDERDFFDVEMGPLAPRRAKLAQYFPEDYGEENEKPQEKISSPKHKRAPPKRRLEPSSSDESSDDERKSYCICKKPYSTRGGWMIRCVACKDWFHGTCIGMAWPEARCIKKYICDSCPGRTVMKRPARRRKTR